MPDNTSERRPASAVRELADLRDQINTLRELIATRVDQGLDTRTQSETFLALLRRRQYLRSLDS